MNEQVDLDALIARLHDAAGSPYTQPEHSDVIEATIRALESTLAELRQERERADGLEYAIKNATGRVLALSQALSRAEETIAAALAEEERCTDQGTRMWRILTEYDDQKGQADD